MRAYVRDTDIALKELSPRVVAVIPKDTLSAQPHSVQFNLSSGRNFVGEVDRSVLNVRVPAGVETMWYYNVESVEMAQG